MSQFMESLEKSVVYLKERYPAELPLLVDLEKKLAYLKDKNRSSVEDEPERSSE